MTATATTAAARQQIRARIRARRRAQSTAIKRAADAAILSHLRRLPTYRAARRIGIFLPFDGEPDLTPLISRDGAKRFFVPIIDGNLMVFAELTAATVCARNSFGILEPVEPVLIDPRSLDLVLTPLVAFDPRGIRLGVGRGYYDRCFAFLRARRVWRHPKLLGIAYSLQRVPELVAQTWDVPLWGAITEEGPVLFGEAGE